ncbi:MAG TPA: ribonuclease P protein component [Candidatus Saccharimonadales bacterium]|nr:ribonuclease P protein component [Candidatus Saccharimonadales bacterium]
MIGNTNRFHGFNALSHVYRHSQTVRGPLLSLKYMPTNRHSYRAAVVVSRKVHKSAVVRNRIRRRVYECIRLAAGEFVAPYDVVFTVFSERVADMPHTELVTMVRKALQKAGILKTL